MGGGGDDKNYERKKTADEQDRSNAEFGHYRDVIESGREQRDKQYNDTFDQTKQNLTGFTGKTGGLEQTDIDRLRGLYNAAPASSGSGGGGGNASGSGSGGGSAFGNVNIPKDSAFGAIGSLGDSEAKGVNIPRANAIDNVAIGSGSNIDGVKGPDESAYKSIDTRYNSSAGDSQSALGGLDFNKTNYASQVAGPNLGAVRSGYTGLANTGGISEGDRNDVLRSSLLNQEATGGYTDNDIRRIRAKAANNASSNFGVVKDSLDRSRAINGNTTGLSNTNFKLMREASKQQAIDKNNAEIGLADAIRANKADAGKFNSGAAAGLIQQRDSTKLAGLGGLGDTEMNEANFGLERAKAADAANANLNMAELQRATGLDSFSLAKSGLLDDASKFGVSAALDKAKGLDTSSVDRAQFGLNKATAQDQTGLQQTSQRLQQATGMDANTAQQVTQQLQRASQMDDQAKAKLNAEIAKATGLDQYTIQSIQQELNKAQGLDSWSINQAQLGQAASNAASANSFRDREAQADNERWIMSQQQSGKQYGTSGLGDLTSLAGSQRLGYDGLYGDALKGRSSASQGAIGLSLQNDETNRSKTGEYITNGLGSLAGLAGGFMSSSGNTGINGKKKVSIPTSVLGKE